MAQWAVRHYDHYGETHTGPRNTILCHLQNALGGKWTSVASKTFFLTSLYDGKSLGT